MEPGEQLSRASSCKLTLDVSVNKLEGGMGYREYNEAEAVDENARQHLEKIYPLECDEKDLTISSDWLFSSGNTKWPEEIKPFMWRYLHDHNLYKVRKENADAVQNLCRELSTRMQLPRDPETEEELRRKVERQIAYVAGQWRDFGLLIANQGLYKKSTVFEELWNESRAEWSSKFQPTSMTGFAQSTLPETSARIVFGDKEFRSENYPRVDPMSPTEILSPGKRKLASMSLEDIDDEEDIITSMRRKRKSSSATKTATSPTKRPSEPVQRRESVRMKSNPIVSPRPKSLRLDARSPTLPRFGEDDDPYGFDFEDETYQPRPSSSRTVQHSSPPKESTHQALSMITGSSSGTTFSTEQPLSTNKAKLDFIFEDSRAAQENPVSAEVFRNSSLSEFFDLVCRKAFKPQGVVDCLTFRYTWGTLDAFVVRRSGDADEWKAVKRKVRNKFLIAREDVRNRDVDFEVWVTCGDTTKEVDHGEVREDGEDW